MTSVELGKLDLRTESVFPLERIPRRKLSERVKDWQSREEPVLKFTLVTVGIRKRTLMRQPTKNPLTSIN